MKLPLSLTANAPTPVADSTAANAREPGKAAASYSQGLEELISIELRDLVRHARSHRLTMQKKLTKAIYSDNPEEDMQIVILEQSAQGKNAEKVSSSDTMEGGRRGNGEQSSENQHEAADETHVADGLAPRSRLMRHSGATSHTQHKMPRVNTHPKLMRLVQLIAYGNSTSGRGLLRDYFAMVHAEMHAAIQDLQSSTASRDEIQSLDKIKETLVAEFHVPLEGNQYSQSALGQTLRLTLPLVLLNLARPRTIAQASGAVARLATLQAL